MYSYLFAARIDLLFFVLGAFLVGKWKKKQIADPYALSAYESVLQKELFFFDVFFKYSICITLFFQIDTEVYAETRKARSVV